MGAECIGSAAPFKDEIANSSLPLLEARAEDPAMADLQRFAGIFCADRR
jgi:hypothetical protein